MGFEKHSDYLIDNSNSTSSRDYLRILFRQKTVVITTIISVLITVFIGIKLKTPVYEAQVKMLISAEKLVQAPNYRDLVGGQNIEEALTQSEIVKSTPVLERVVRVLNLDQRPEDYEKQFASPLKCKWIDYKKKIDRLKTRGNSAAELPRVVFQKALDDLRKSIDVEPIRGTNLFTIRVKAFDPSEAAITANVVSRSYIIYDLEQQLADLTLKYAEKHPLVLQLEESIGKMKRSLSGAPVSNIEAIGPATVKVIEQASTPFRPAGMRKVLILILALILSTVLGVTLAFLVEYLDPTFTSVEQIEKEVNLKLLGSIPRKQIGEKALVQEGHKTTRHTHFYQMLVDQLYLLIRDKKIKSIVITTIGSSEKPEIVLANLGMLLSQKNGYPVLLVDANLRKPSLHKCFKLSNVPGLSELVEGKTIYEETIKTIKNNLHIMTAGHTEQNPVVLLDSPVAAKLFKEVSRTYKIVFYDCPNVNGYKDSMILSRHADATILIINEGETRRKVLTTMIKSLAGKDNKIIGVIYNKRTFPIPRMVYERI